MCSDKGYQIQENTENSADPSVSEVIDLVQTRAAEPRPTSHTDAHFDRYLRDAIERFGEDDVVDCIRLILVDSYTHRMAGTAAFGTEEYVWGINVGVAATAYLRELRQKQETSGSS